ncbi:MAG: hypothetical protein WB565_03465, partial [Acidimicrobiales bacterium]
MSESILLGLGQAIDGFVVGQISLPELQARLAAGASALDTSYSELVEELRRVDSDLEQIQFTMLQDEQAPAAIFRLDATRDAVESAL